jgi:ABC-2 type transport system permease protein
MTAATTTFGARRRSAARELLTAIGTIMTKELRSRMRGRRAFIVLTVYLGLLALLTYGVYLVVAPNAQNMVGGGVGLGQANASALIGQSIFTVLSILQLILVCFIAPAFTAGQISLEREKQTLDLLVSTPMRPSAIVLGKLAAALAFVVLMIVAAVPITAIVLMYGGASIDDIVRQQVVLLLTALALGTIGLFFSALLKRTQAATVLTYITMLCLTLGTMLLWVFWSILANQDAAGFGVGPTQRAPEQLLYLNPGIAMLDVVAPAEPGGMSGITRALAGLRGVDPFMPAPDCFGPDCPLDGGFGGLGGPPDPADLSGYWWPRVGLTYVAGSILLALASMRLVVPAGMRWAFGRRRRVADADGEPAGAGRAAEIGIEELPR